MCGRTQHPSATLHLNRALQPSLTSLRVVRCHFGLTFQAARKAALILHPCLALQVITTKDTFTYILNLEYLEVRFEPSTVQHAIESTLNP